MPVILGCDPDANAITAAQANAERAGLMTLKDMQPPSPDSLPKEEGKSKQSLIHFERHALADNMLTTGLTPGLVVTNPPYGERLSEAALLGPLYAELGQWLRSQCPGWHAGVITDNRDLAKQIGVRARKINTFYNGALECRLLQFDIEPEWFMRSTNV